ncbi:hypothetical protein R6Q57_000338 [Mikania cordata]
MSGQFRTNGKIRVRVLTDLPITGKPTEVGMERGKGNPTGWIAHVSTGQIPFEMDDWGKSGPGFKSIMSWCSNGNVWSCHGGPVVNIAVVVMYCQSEQTYWRQNNI